MNASHKIPVAAVIGLALISLRAFGSANVKEQVVGPVAENAKYVVSPRGAHLATVAPKGSRMNVIVDGVAGPRFDEIISPTTRSVDPRPYQIVDPNTLP